MQGENVKLPNINKRGNSQGSQGFKRTGSQNSFTGNAKSAFIAKKERKE